MVKLTKNSQLWFERPLMFYGYFPLWSPVAAQSKFYCTRNYGTCLKQHKYTNQTLDTEIVVIEHDEIKNRDVSICLYVCNLKLSKICVMTHCIGFKWLMTQMADSHFGWCLMDFQDQ